MVKLIARPYRILMLLVISASACNTKDISINGVVQSVSAGGQGDIVITLENIRGVHYIRDHASAMTTERLSELLLGQKVNMVYQSPSALIKISPATETRLIQKVTLRDSLVYARSN